MAKTKKKFTVKEDMAYDKAHGIKEGSKRDIALDKKRGVLAKELAMGLHKKVKKVVKKGR